MLLKRLAASLPPPAAALVPLLDPQIRTTESVILTPRSVLQNILSTALTPSDPTESSVAATRRAATISAALDLLLAHCLDRVPVQNGAEALDLQETREAERGWYGFGVLEDVLPWSGVGVMEIAGGKGVGKSLLALHATLRVLKEEQTATARWVDTEGAFNASRAQAILTALGADASVLDRLTVSRVFRLEPELLDVLGEARNDPSTRVLVIDNIATLFRDALMGTTAQGHAAMAVALEEVAELTYSLGLMTIVINNAASSIPTNPISSFSTTTVKPALGVTLTFTVDIELLLQDTGRVFGLADEGERERAGSAPGLRILVEVLKSRVSPAGLWGVVETDGISVLNVAPPAEEDELTLYRSAGGDTGRPALGGLHETLEPAIAPLRATRR